MTPEIIYVENGNKPMRNDINPTEPQADSAETKSWYLRSCRFQLIDRLMILACLITSITLASWTIAQESSGSSQEATASSDATVTADESTSDKQAKATSTDEPNQATDTAEASPDKAATDKAATDKAATDKAATDKAASDKAASDKAASGKGSTEKAVDTAIDRASDSAIADSEGVAPRPVELAADAESLDDNVARALGDGPDWLNNPPVASDGFEVVVVESDPKVTHEDALASLDAKIREKLERYIDNYLGVPRAHKYLPFDLGHYKSRLILEEGDRYDKVAKYSVGTMHESYAKLTIDSQFRQDIHHRWHEVVTSMRLFRTGGIVAGVLALMLVVFSYLRLDTATRGYYSGRLRMLGGLAILGLIGLAAYFFRYNLEWLQMLIHG